MSKKKEFGDGILYNITYYIWWFLMGNFYFWLVNIPFIVIFLAMTLSGVTEMNWLLMLSLLPVGPGLTALLSVMGKLTREGDISVTRDFFKAYKVNFLESIFFWTLEMIFLIVLWVDILYFNSHASMRFWAFVPKFFFLICLALIFYIFPIISRFYMKKTDVIKLAVKYLFKKIYVCVTAFAAIYLTIMVLPKINSLLALLFSVGIISYVVMYLEKRMLLEIEESIKKPDNLTE